MLFLRDCHEGAPICIVTELDDYILLRNKKCKSNNSNTINHNDKKEDSNIRNENMQETRSEEGWIPKFSTQALLYLRKLVEAHINVFLYTYQSPSEVKAIFQKNGIKENEAVSGIYCISNLNEQEQAAATTLMQLSPNTKNKQKELRNSILDKDKIMDPENYTVYISINALCTDLEERGYDSVVPLKRSQQEPVIQGKERLEIIFPATPPPEYMSEADFSSISPPRPTFSPSKFFKNNHSLPSSPLLTHSPALLQNKKLARNPPTTPSRERTYKMQKV